MSDFQPAFNNLIRLEGGYAEPPQVEQPTKYGITQSDLDAFIAANNDLTVLWNKCVEGLDLSQAAIYIQNEWWNKARFSDIEDQALCNYVFQVCFVAGMQTGIELLQQAINAFHSLEGNTALKVDGVLGNETLDELSITDEMGALQTMRCFAIRHYLDIVRKNPAQQKYLVGWLNRALDGLA